MRNIGIFGDSYAQEFGTWTRNLRSKIKDGTVDALGKGGSNQFYSLMRWQWSIDEFGPDHYNYAIFTFTWHHRLSSVYTYRNNQFCAFSELRPFEIDSDIVDERTNQEFLKTIPMFYKYIYDDRWALFNHEQTVKYILQDLPPQHPKTKFIFIPNTQISREIAKRHFRGGILLDFAFEELSNRETGSPGPMPINCGRPGHLSPENHERFATFMLKVIDNYDSNVDRILPVDLHQFDIDK
jgi:hypothetical protein